MDETLNMDNQGLDRQEPETNQGGILRRLRDRDLLRKRKAEAEEKETKQWVYGVESKRRRARGEERSGTGKRGRPRKTENLLEVLPIQEEEKEEDPVQHVPQPPAEESLPEAVEAGPAQTFYTRLIATVNIPTAPAPPLDVTSVQTPVVTSYSTFLFPTAPTLTLTLNPTPAQTPTLTPTPAPNLVPEPTVLTPSTQSPPLPPSSGQSETPVEAPVSAALALAPAPASSALVHTTEYSTMEALGQVTIEDLGPDEMENVCSLQKDEAVNRFDTDSVEGPSPPNVDQSTMFSSPLLTALSATQRYFTEN
ncbi:unnamed protein product [Lota lota]